MYVYICTYLCIVAELDITSCEHVESVHRFATFVISPSMLQTDSTAMDASKQPITQILIRSCTYTHILIHSYTHMLIHSYTHILIYSYACTHTHILIYSYPSYLYTNILILMYSCTHLIYSYSYPHILVHSYTHIIVFSYTHMFIYPLLNS